jgi:hypothetical protein
MDLFHGSAIRRAERSGQQATTITEKLGFRNRGDVRLQAAAVCESEVFSAFGEMAFMLYGLFVVLSAAPHAQMITVLRDMFHFG